MVVQYVAEDGTIFDDEDACLEYEGIQRISKLLKSKLYDANGKELVFDGKSTTCENCYYLDILSLEDAKTLHQCFEYWGFPSPFSPNETYTLGRFYWSTYYDEWRNIEELYNAYAEKLKIFEGE